MPFGLPDAGTERPCRTEAVEVEEAPRGSTYASNMVGLSAARATVFANSVRFSRRPRRISIADCARLARLEAPVAFACRICTLAAPALTDVRPLKSITAVVRVRGAVRKLPTGCSRRLRARGAAISIGGRTLRDSASAWPSSSVVSKSSATWPNNTVRH